MKNKLSNVELMLLELIAEGNGISGYEISQIVSFRGYKNWADTGNTSIYTGLKKLKNRHFLDSYVDTQKKGKGPLPTKFKMNKSGMKALNDAILDGFENSRVTEGRFTLCIAGLVFVDKKKVIDILENKNKETLASYKMVRDKFISDGGDKLGLNTKEVFRQSFFFIEKGIEFIDSLIENLKKEVN